MTDKKANDFKLHMSEQAFEYGVSTEFGQYRAVSTFV